MDDHLLPIVEDPYIIHENTMLITPFYTEQAYLHSHVMEVYQEIQVKENPRKIVMNSLEYFGADLPGRNQSAGGILRNQRLLPVLISERSKMCMIPTCSPTKSENCWISYRHVRSIDPKGNRSIVTLENHKRVELNITRDTLERRIEKAARLVDTYEIRYQKITDLYRSQIIAESQTIYKIPRFEN
ncbi:competence protein ComK [Metabacillus niabensis]|uniref:Competence protein ComK n=1 Tax=Metabacillus niabensis TaxID=324854 RepID=A0ABT9Z4L6_9BACI|nr:competence protein ComK [Metabacillus niabensis]MDQ0227204.1 competence protein ComK [Metabacillus niabensis]